MTREEKMIFFNEIKEIISNKEVQKMQGYIQHGGTTTYAHSLNVALYSYILSKKFNLKIQEKQLLRGAMLHDFYLYDWHDKTVERKKMHGFNHPKVALENANKHFELTKKEENIIHSHMWPLTLRAIPKSKEAIIICLVDKWCAIIESKEHYMEKIKSKQLKNINSYK